MDLFIYKTGERVGTIPLSMRADVQAATDNAGPEGAFDPSAVPGLLEVFTSLADEGCHAVYAQ